jgi:hypothetical protein
MRCFVGKLIGEAVVSVANQFVLACACGCDTRRCFGCGFYSHDRTRSYDGVAPCASATLLITRTCVTHQVDELGLTSEKYIPVNETLRAFPLRITVDRSDLEHDTMATTATAGGMSPARWRLLSHLSTSLESQKQLGFEESDIDDLRRLIADTNVTLLGITILASGLHLLFEFMSSHSMVLDPPDECSALESWQDDRSQSVFAQGWNVQAQ